MSVFEFVLGKVTADFAPSSSFYLSENWLPLYFLAFELCLREEVLFALLVWPPRPLLLFEGPPRLAALLGCDFFICLRGGKMPSIFWVEPLFFAIPLALLPSELEAKPWLL
jgi:hypothetical protein